MTVKQYSSSGGGAAINWASGETPSGAINGVNMTYTISHTPANASLMYYVNGVFQTSGTDYTIAGSTITRLGTALNVGDSHAVGPYHY